MATPEAPASAAPAEEKNPRIDTQVARASGASVQQAEPGGELDVALEDSDGISIEIGPDGKVIGGATPEELEAEAEADLQVEDDQPGEPPAETEAPAAGDYPDLGEYDPADEAKRTEFDKRYLTPEGDLNPVNIGGEFWQNFAKAAAGGEAPKDHGYLHESTYKYLEDTFKVSRAFITQYEQGQVALAKGRDAEFHASVGGEERWAQALEFGRKTYTPEQQERFRALQAKGGPEFQEQAELLLSRAERGGALKGAAPGEQSRQPGRRGSSPRKDATSGAGAPRAAGDTFKTAGEYQTSITEANLARKAAKTPKDKQAAESQYNAVQAKARRSGLFNKR